MLEKQDIKTCWKNMAAIDKVTWIEAAQKEEEAFRVSAFPHLRIINLRIFSFLSILT